MSIKVIKCRWRGGVKYGEYGVIDEMRGNRQKGLEVGRGNKEGE
jgi:hypothetical protein